MRTETPRTSRTSRTPRTSRSTPPLRVTHPTLVARCSDCVVAVRYLTTRRAPDGWATGTDAYGTYSLCKACVDDLFYGE